MAGGGGKLGEGAEELGENAGDTDKGGRHDTDIGKFLQSVSATGAAVWGGDVVGDPKDGAGAERISPWGGKTTHWETAAEREGRGMALPLTRGGHEEAGLTYIRTSILRRQNTVAQYIAFRPLLDLCVGARAREGAKVTLRWWEQAGIDWEKAKAKGPETD